MRWNEMEEEGMYGFLTGKPAVHSQAYAKSHSSSFHSLSLSTHTYIQLTAMHAEHLACRVSLQKPSALRDGDAQRMLNNRVSMAHLLNIVCNRSE
jgi:hypothetical protein